MNLQPRHSYMESEIATYILRNPKSISKRRFSTGIFFSSGSKWILNGHDSGCWGMEHLDSDIHLPFIHVLKGFLRTSLLLSLSKGTYLGMFTGALLLIQPFAGKQFFAARQKADDGYSLTNDGFKKVFGVFPMIDLLSKDSVHSLKLT